MSDFDLARLGVLLEYMLSHGREHVAENTRWLEKVHGLGIPSVAGKLEEVVRLAEKSNGLIEEAKALLEGKMDAGTGHSHAADHAADAHAGAHAHGDGTGHVHIQLHTIGVIRTPYKESAPRQPDPGAQGDFKIVVDEKWAEGLHGLETRDRIDVLFYFDRSSRDVPLRFEKPHGSRRQVGVFSSRSPLRPNPIGLSTVEIKRISGRTIHISGIDVLDMTPLIDIKPYIGNDGGIENYHPEGEKSGC